MQNLREIRQLLLSEGFRPNKGLGQSFLIDGNLMRKLVDLADLTGAEIVLEVGSATGSLTEELLLRAKKVVAVEVDKVLAGILHRRLAGRENLIIINRSILAGKQKIAPEVIQVLSNQFDDSSEVHLVANLPFCVAVPVIMNCLILSWRAIQAASESDKKEAILFTRLTFTVQQELAERLTASPGQRAYGSISVLAALLSRIKTSAIIPPQAFWPRPEVFSRMMGMDFDKMIEEMPMNEMEENTPDVKFDCGTKSVTVAGKAYPNATYCTFEGGEEGGYAKGTTYADDSIPISAFLKFVMNIKDTEENIDMDINVDMTGFKTSGAASEITGTPVPFDFGAIMGGMAGGGMPPMGGME